MANIELKSFRVDGNLEQKLEDFVNGPAQNFDLLSSFGPVKKEDGNLYVFFVFKQKEPAGA